MDYKKKIESYKEEALELTRKLVSFPTVLDEYKENSDAPFGEANKEALNYLLDYAKNDGFNVLNSDNYAGHIEYGKGEVLGILAHLDVVPVVESEWETPPFQMDIRDEKMYGRGTLDDKGPLVASYIALKILKDSGFKPKKKIRLIVGCDEESGSRCLEHYYKTNELPSVGFSPDACFPLINGEKAITSYDIVGSLDDDIIETFDAGTRYNIVPSKAVMTLKKDLSLQYKEYLYDNNIKGEIKNGKYIAYGVAAHGMCPEQGVNAAYILFDFLSKYTDSKLAKFVEEYFLFDTRGNKIGYNIEVEEMGDLTSNFAIVKAKNNEFKIGFNCRVPLDKQHKVMWNVLDKATKEYGYSYNVLNEGKCHYIPSTDPLVETLMSVYREVTGDMENGPICIGGGTYAHELENAVAFGPLKVGREDVCHIANEYMYLEDFFESIEVYIKAIYELAK